MGFTQRSLRRAGRFGGAGGMEGGCYGEAAEGVDAAAERLGMAGYGMHQEAHQVGGKADAAGFRRWRAEAQQVGGGDSGGS